MLIWLGLLWLALAIEPRYRHDWLLENLLVFVTAAVMLLTYKKFQFSLLSYGLLTLFLSLHLVGAHYTYSETPLGFWLQGWFGWQRNHYDRLIHGAFGLLCYYPCREWLQRAATVNQRWLWLLTLSAILAFSAIFELIEAIAAMIVNPELGAAYLGTQGDEWDAQKDTLMALLGGVAAMLSGWLINYQTRSSGTG
ncbi:MAG: DUF2238 domain-containing protein [Wenzhouxiangellaceae bacterium]